MYTYLPLVTCGSSLYTHYRFRCCCCCCCWWCWLINERVAVVTGSGDGVDRMDDDGTTTPLTSYSLPVDVMSSRTGVSTVSSPRWPCVAVEPTAPPPTDYDDDDYYYRASPFTRPPPTVTVSSSGYGRHVIHHSYIRPPPTASYCCADQPTGVASRCSACGHHISPPPYDEHWMRA